MFKRKDAEEELQRLEQELLELEEPEQEPEEEEYLDPAAYEEEPAGEAPRVYRNFSNNYGKDLRNFASGYRAYNADRTDVDPEELSRQLLEPEEPPRRGPVVLALILAMAAVIAVLWLILRFGGIL